MSTTQPKGKSYATPQRGLPLENEMPPPKEVTPFDPSPSNSTTSSVSNKSVRFEGKAVSRRGGRYGSPSRISYKSPRRSNSQEVPSLCSSKDSPPSDEDEGTGEGPTPSQISFAKPASASPLASPNKRKDQRRNVTFSPPRPQLTESEKQSHKKTPTRSPNFHNLPSLQDAKLSSPCGIFLSPCPPSPSIPQIKKQFEKEGNKRASTPTELDFSKSHKISASFDASNVLAWLQSPTANGLFSPGAFSSAANTPRGGPRTPTASTSFFFSDVAGLPRGEPKRMSSMIAISPLASRKGKYDESPKPRSMPMLGDSPAVKDAVERDLMEDEDLSVLLQLASHNTPRKKDSSDVFRSTRGHKRADYRDNENPALQLPMIGGKDGDTGPTRKLWRKLGKDSKQEDFTPPTLGIRSSSSGASREIFSRSEEEGTVAKPKEGYSDKKDNESSSRKKKDAPKKVTNKNGYPYSRYPPHPDAPPPYYPPMPGSVPSMPPGGSMRVVVGGPPPMSSRSSGANKGSSTSPNRSTPPRHPGGYPMHPEGYGPPPPGSMYPPMSHHYPPPHMAMPPYGHYAPPPRHIPMYSHPPPKGKGKVKGKPTKASKRPLPTNNGLNTKHPTSSKKLRPTKQSGGGFVSKFKKEDDHKPATVPSSISSAASVNTDRSALNAALLRGVTMRPSGKWQAQLYYAGKSRYIGVFDTREKAALAYEIAREQLKSSDGKSTSSENSQSTKATENAVNAARKAAFEVVHGGGGKDSRISTK